MVYEFSVPSLVCVFKDIIKPPRCRGRLLVFSINLFQFRLEVLPMHNNSTTLHQKAKEFSYFDAGNQTQDLMNAKNVLCH